MWLRRKRPIVQPPVDTVVDEMRSRTHAAANEAKENADRLNKVFRQNGITLNILRAAGGGKNGH